MFEAKEGKQGPDRQWLQEEGRGLVADLSKAVLPFNRLYNLAETTLRLSKTVCAKVPVTPENPWEWHFPVEANK